MKNVVDNCSHTRNIVATWRSNIYYTWRVYTYSPSNCCCCGFGAYNKWQKSYLDGNTSKSVNKIRKGVKRTL